jgi:hypothetical protein
MSNGKEIDLFRWMPRDAFDILSVFHEHAHALEIRIRVNCTKATRSAPFQTSTKERDVPSHTQTVLSRLQLASSVPELEYATLLHSVSCPSKRLAHSHSPPFTTPSLSSSASCSQIPILASKDAVASVFPEGAHATARTVLVCPVGMVEICENVIS